MSCLQETLLSLQAWVFSFLQPKLLGLQDPAICFLAQLELHGHGRELEQ